MGPGCVAQIDATPWSGSDEHNAETCTSPVSRQSGLHGVAARKDAAIVGVIRGDHSGRKTAGDAPVAEAP